LSKKPTPTSIHESAHAITAHLLGEKVDRLVNEGETGYASIFHCKDKVIRTAVVIAGHEADVLWCGAKVTIVPYHDWKALDKIGTSSIGANIIREPLVKFLKGNKRVIFHIARVLDERGEMSRRIFLREFKKSWHIQPKEK